MDWGHRWVNQANQGMRLSTMSPGRVQARLQPESARVSTSDHLSCSKLMIVQHCDCPKGYCVREIQTGSRIKMCESCPSVRLSVRPSVHFCSKSEILVVWDKDTKRKSTKPCSRCSDFKINIVHNVCFRFCTMLVFKKLILDYTCRARWPEELLCWLSQFLKSNIVQIFKTNIVHNVDFKIWASRTRFSDFAPSICVPKCQNLTFWAKRTQTDGQTDGRTDTIHTSLSLTLSVLREHNSPSGNYRDTVCQGGRMRHYHFRDGQMVSVNCSRVSSSFCTSYTTEKSLPVPRNTFRTFYINLRWFSFRNVASKCIFSCKIIPKRTIFLKSEYVMCSWPLQPQ